MSLGPFLISDNFLKELTDLDYITMVSKKPIIRTVSNKVKEILY